jgi:hypothetical protein
VKLKISETPIAKREDLPPALRPFPQREVRVVRRGEKCLVVVDGVEGKEYDNIGGLSYDPDKKRGLGACPPAPYLAA